MTIRYRADIDGLRALAVVAVILYHFKVPGFSGGFVGVDVFFVISGFLIASLIDREIADGRFSLLHFYERRVRRIFPALIVLLLAVSVLAYMELLTVPYRRFGQSVAATSVFLSNVEFWLEGEPYFAAAPAQQKPLFHTWSLAVEEQFYLLFPLLFMLLARYPRRWTIVVLASLLVASLGFRIWSGSAAPNVAFFLFPSRIWELLLGALIAVGAFPIVLSRPINNALSAMGIAMIGSAIYAPLAFRGVAALFPCAGSALVIYGGLRDSPALNRALSTRSIVFVGLISYSLYLWHWPLYVFATYHVARALSGFESACLIAASFVIAGLSWKFIEQPFRRPGGVAPRRQIFIQAAVIMSIFGVSGVVISLTSGLPQRFTPDVQALLAPGTYFRGFSCEPGKGVQTIAGQVCRIGRLDGSPTFLVWGDSHAAALSPAVAVAAERLGYSGLSAARPGCPPLLRYSISYGDDVDDPECLQHNEVILEFLQTQKINDIILIGRWTLIAEGSDYVQGGGESSFRVRSLEETHRAFAESLGGIVNVLRAAGKRVIVVGPVPEIGLNVPAALARRRLRGLPEDIGPARAEFEARNKTVLDYLASMDSAVERVYPHLILCTAARCAVAREGKPLYFDGNHLDRFGAETISEIFEPILAGKP